VKYLDVPKYKVRPKPNRFLVDRLLILIGFGILLYIGIYVNYYLLNASLPVFVNWLFIIGILILIALELLSCYIKYGNYVYDFHEQRLFVNFGKIREISYVDIKDISYSSNFIDKWMKTGSVVLNLKNGKSVKLKYLDNPNQIYFWMQKIIK